MRVSLSFAAACAIAGCGGLVDPGESTDAAVDVHGDHQQTIDAATVDADVVEDAAAPKKDASVVLNDAAADSGQPIVSVVAYTPFPGLIALDATNVYWAVFAGASGTEISKCAKSGCNKTPTVLWSSQNFSVIGFGLANDSLWFTANSQYIASCATAGCNGTPTNLLSSLDTVFTAFGVDSNAVYFAGTGSPTIASCALTGCNESPTAVASANTVYGFAQTDALLLWSENEDSIEACAKTGCTSPTVLASGRVGATNVATDGSAVYWIELGEPDGQGEYTNGAVMGCALAGCNNTPTALASYATWSGGTALTADASGVYWATSQTKQNIVNQIFGCANASCNGQPKYYGYTGSPSYGIATDATDVYWSDVIGGAIVKGAK